MFTVIKAYGKIPMNLTKRTIHFERDRQARDQFIKDVIGYGDTLAVFQVDKGHKNGREIHELTDTGIIRTYNSKGELITPLIAVPYQVKRLYRGAGLKAPHDVLVLAQIHESLGYNTPEVCDSYKRQG